MMMSLFSVFDPTSYFGLSLSWMIMIIIYMFIPIKYYLLEGKIIKMMVLFYNKISMIFKEVSIPNHLGLNFLVVVTFIYLMISNLLGLFPFIFTGTAHPVITLGWGVILWLSFFLMGFNFNMKMSCAHLVPEGSPLFLSPFMVMIESISHLIRPFTLSIRLAANMMAGHLIIGLLSSISLMNVFSLFSSLFLQTVLLILEFAVAIIQSFVFSILLLLYALEYY